ncbi:MAG: hypothetical protein MK207_09090 [Saprospiraceae bacterium]|nr:hypothetical protein [Saprospiraceae bacterium]
MKKFVLLLTICFISYKVLWQNTPDENLAKPCVCSIPNSDDIYRGSAKNLKEASLPSSYRALLANRFNSLEDLKSIINIEYINTGSDSAGNWNSMVKIKHCSNGLEVTSILKSGVDQGNIIDVKESGFWKRVQLLFKTPFAIANRIDLRKIFTLARKRDYLFGEDDKAFFDLAQAMVYNIRTKDLAYIHPRDSSEKGYLNSFNHITAQALITSCFSEQLADFVADVHERYKMPQLVTGKFTREQIIHPDDNPIDNYVDLINNEWGQEIGKKLRKKFKITRNTYWTPELLADYLNEIQVYYSWSFQIAFKPFVPNNEIIKKFSNKINKVKAGFYW